MYIQFILIAEKIQTLKIILYTYESLNQNHHCHQSHSPQSRLSDKSDPHSSHIALDESFRWPQTLHVIIIIPPLN